MHLTPAGEPPLRTLAWALFSLGICCYLLLSAETLAAIGIPYAATEGSPAAKFHPGTYCFLLSWILALTSYGNPVRALGRQFANHRLLAGYFSCILSVFFWVLYRHGASGSAAIIESLLAPAIGVFAIYLFGPNRQLQIIPLVVLLLTANALLAIMESLAGTHFGPQEAGVPQEYFRATALLGHPLNAAQVFVSLLPALTLLSWPLVVRLVIGLLFILALFAFGGRASLSMGFLFYGGYALYRLSLAVLHGRFSYLQLTGGSLALMTGITAVAGIVAISGIGERFFENLYWDGSAEVRGRVWEVFSYLSTTDLWIGIAPAEIDRLSLRIGLDLQFEAIENFWLYLLMQYGIVGYTPFILGLALLLTLLWRTATPAMRVAILVYFFVASGANALATKTMSLTMLAVVVVAGKAFGNRSPLTDDIGGRFRPVWADTGNGRA